MTWFKVDDKLAFHRKTLAAGNAAMGAWVRMGSLCGDQESDGLISREAAHLIGSDEEIAKLLEVCLLEDKGALGYQMHDFLQYNPSAKSLKSQRKVWKEKKQRQRELSPGDTRTCPPENPLECLQGSPGRDLIPLLVVNKSEGEGEFERGGAAGGVTATVAKAYADGVASGAGAPWTLPDANKESQVILSAAALHKPNLRGEGLLSWVRHSAETYRRTMADRWEYQRGFRPSKWLEWLNAGGEQAPSRKIIGHANEIPKQPIAEHRAWKMPEDA